MVGLLHPVASLRDGPEREKSDDSDREVKQVKHGISPCGGFVTARISRKKNRTGSGTGQEPSSRPQNRSGRRYRASSMGGVVHAHHEVTFGLQGSTPAIRSRRPPVPPATDDDQGAALENRRDGAPGVPAEVHLNAHADIVRGEAIDDGFGFERRPSTRFFHRRPPGHGAEMDQRHAASKRCGQPLRRAYGRQRFVERREEDVDLVGAEGAGAIAPGSRAVAPFLTCRWKFDDFGHLRLDDPPSPAPVGSNARQGGSCRSLRGGGHLHCRKPDLRKS